MTQQGFSLGLTDPFEEDQKHGFYTEPIHFDFDGMPMSEDENDPTKKERKAAKRAAARLGRETRIAAGGNPKAWKNMSKGGKAKTVLMMIGMSMMAGGNPAMGLALREKEKRVAQDRIDKLSEAKKDRAHDLVKIKAETEGDVEVTKVGGEIVSDQIAQTGDVQMSLLDREYDYKATEQQNELSYRGDAALLEIAGEKMLQDIRISAQERLEGSSQTHQTSLALLQARQAMVTNLEESMRVSLGPGNEMMVLDYIGRVTPYLTHGGELPSYTPEMVEALENIAAETTYRRKLDMKSAQLDNLVNARQILAVASPKGERMMDPGSEEFSFIQGIAGNVNSLAGPEEASVAMASLHATERGQILKGHLTQLFNRPATPGLMETDLIVSEAQGLDIPVNPVVLREWMFQIGSDPDVVDDRVPLPQGYLEPDPLDRTPEATMAKKMYSQYIDPVLGIADAQDPELGRALRTWLESHKSGDYRQDYGQLWRIMKQYQSADPGDRTSLLNYLKSGKQGRLSTTERLDMTSDMGW